MKLFNKASIFIFSILLTAFGGALLFCYNLRQTGKGKIALPFAIIALVATAIIRNLVHQTIPGSATELFIPNIIGGLTLIYPCWNAYFGEHLTYKTRSVLIPSIVVIFLWGGLYLCNVYLT